MPFEIGLTQGSMVTLRSMGVWDPKSEYKPAKESEAVHSGRQVGIGFPHVLWSWGYLYWPQVKALRELCAPPNLSQNVWIKTKVTGLNLSYVTFQAVMWWPLDLPYSCRVVLPVQIEFKHAYPADVDLSVLLNAVAARASGGTLSGIG